MEASDLNPLDAIEIYMRIEGVPLVVSKAGQSTVPEQYKGWLSILEMSWELYYDVQKRQGSRGDDPSRPRRRSRSRSRSLSPAPRQHQTNSNHASNNSHNSEEAGEPKEDKATIIEQTHMLDASLSRETDEASPSLLALNFSRRMINYVDIVVLQAGSVLAEYKLEHVVLNSYTVTVDTSENSFQAQSSSRKKDQLRFSAHSLTISAAGNSTTTSILPDRRVFNGEPIEDFDGRSELERALYDSKKLALLSAEAEVKS